ncbi:MAG: hypothetical protein KGM99_00430 [Burkholderiales bacterium]|nr:hypothetical protein [Burkholderiales bacterium]
MRKLKAGFCYFAVVFGTGFLLALIRIPFLVPHVGVRYAELLEMPLMGIAMFIAARWVVRHFALPADAGLRLQTGGLALAFMIIAELALAALLSGQNPVQYVATRDAVSGSVYLFFLLFFGLLPWLLHKTTAKDDQPFL